MTEKLDVLTRLRDAVLGGDYSPRQRLIEAELAEQFAVSRFAVRNALIALAADGLVELQPNRGARIREISVEEAIEIAEIRRAVEGFVAARAAENASDSEIENLQQLGQEMRSAVDAGELLRYSELNAKLHSTLRDIANHSTAARIIAQLNGQVVRYQFRLSLYPGRPNVSLPEHLAIIDAVTARDSDAAQAAMEAHVSSVIEALRSQSSHQRAASTVGL